MILRLFYCSPCIRIELMFWSLNFMDVCSNKILSLVLWHFFVSSFGVIIFFSLSLSLSTNLFLFRSSLLISTWSQESWVQDRRMAYPRWFLWLLPHSSIRGNFWLCFAVSTAPSQSQVSCTNPTSAFPIHIGSKHHLLLLMILESYALGYGLHVALCVSILF